MHLSTLLNNIIHFIRFISVEIIIITGLLIVGIFLIFPYFTANYLGTGYQDWIYHAFRIKSLSLYGISSWDHIWANGINHWRVYQFLPHLVTWLVIQYTQLNIPRSMILLIITIFLTTRISTYIFLRNLNTTPFFAFFSTLLSFGFAQQWLAMKDYSIFLVSIFIPIYMWLWIKCYSQVRLIFIVSSISGWAWVWHPVLGLFLTILWLTLQLMLWHKTTLARKFVSIIFFIITSLGFTIPYLTLDYKFSNPFFASTNFLKNSIPFDYLGMSLSLFIFLFGSWLWLLFASEKIPQWSKVLLVIVTGFICLIWLGINGYTPAIVNQLQFSRGVVFVGFMLPFVIGPIWAAGLKNWNSKFVWGIFSMLTAVVITNAISVGSSVMAAPLKSISNPVSLYFIDKPLPSGGVYIEHIAESSYAADPNIRFINSYNEHLLPSPLSLRFIQLLRPDLAYSGLPVKHLKTLNSYIKVLNVQYLFLPANSPLVPILTNPQFSSFILENKIIANNESYAVLVNTNSPSYAYLMPEIVAETIIFSKELPQPTLDSRSYEQWDSNVVFLAEQLERPSVNKLQIEFKEKNIISIVNIDTNLRTSNNQILLLQSYDQNWKAANNLELNIKPTSLRFITFILPNDFTGNHIDLINEWPVWHWPIQYLSGSGLIAALLITLII